MSTFITDFESCVERKLMKDGTHEIHCKLGLWGVSGRDRHQVEREARHYWMQYLTGGEYTTRGTHLCKSLPVNNEK